MLISLLPLASAHPQGNPCSYGGRQWCRQCCGSIPCRTRRTLWSLVKSFVLRGRARTKPCLPQAAWCPRGMECIGPGQHLAGKSPGHMECIDPGQDLAASSPGCMERIPQLYFRIGPQGSRTSHCRGGWNGQESGRRTAAKAEAGVSAAKTEAPTYSGPRAVWCYHAQWR